MREIEFRAKAKNKNMWVYGVPVNVNTNDETNSIELVDSIEYKRYRCMCCPDEDYVYSTEIIETTIGQYTGLKDKNGQKIFEGDIVENSLGDKFIVDLSFEDNVDLFPTCRCVLPNISCREVVGNIYDNPELLKGE